MSAFVEARNWNFLASVRNERIIWGARTSDLEVGVDERLPTGKKESIANRQGIRTNGK